MDSCLAGMQRLEQQQADYTATKSKELTLPESIFLAYDNVTQVWRVPQLDVSEMKDIPNACFKSCDLNRVLELWIRNGRIKQDDHIVSCVDFFRKYLRTACDPPQLIQRYAVRLSHSVKPSLHDLPEQIVEPLIGSSILFSSASNFNS
ncbi:unnamed protein product [Heligmosomoides polygyrus]|uniref:FBA_2 domain-containing protein n=1 Tax=Heligmosomoides polygyrus TaxID=6339 RepID=A0A183G3X8_HELPZ|nr:unnamed protein product [Heligmosomoides polygyrus]